MLRYLIPRAADAEKFELVSVLYKHLMYKTSLPMLLTAFDDEDDRRKAIGAFLTLHSETTFMITHINWSFIPVHHFETVSALAITNKYAYQW